MDAINLLKTIVIIQIIFSVAINMISYSLPSEVLQTKVIEQTWSEEKDETQIVRTFNETAEKMKKSSILDYVFLIIHTGNLIIDLFANFIFAIPAIFTAIVSPFFLFVPVDHYYQVLIKGLIMAVGTVIYLILIISLIANLRAGRQIV